MFWGGFFNVDDKIIQVSEDEQITHQPGFWDIPKNAEGILKRIKTNNIWIKAYNDAQLAVDDLTVLFEFWQAGETTEEEVDEQLAKTRETLDELEFKSTLTEQEDQITIL